MTTWDNQGPDSACDWCAGMTGWPHPGPHMSGDVSARARKEDERQLKALTRRHEALTLAHMLHQVQQTANPWIYHPGMTVHTLPVVGWTSVPDGVMSLARALRRPFALQFVYAGDQPAPGIVGPGGTPTGGSQPRFLLIAMSEDPNYQQPQHAAQAGADDEPAPDEAPSANGQQPPAPLPIRGGRNRLRNPPTPGPQSEGP